MQRDFTDTLYLQRCNAIHYNCLAFHHSSLIISQWFPPSQFGTLWSVLSSSSNVALTIGPFLAAHVIRHHGWRFSLLLSGTYAYHNFLGYFLRQNQQLAIIAKAEKEIKTIEYICLPSFRLLGSRHGIGFLCRNGRCFG